MSDVLERLQHLAPQFGGDVEDTIDAALAEIISLRSRLEEIRKVMDRPREPGERSWQGERDETTVTLIGNILDGAARPCTCHPDDNPPVPCARRYALTECRATVVEKVYHCSYPGCGCEEGQCQADDANERVVETHGIKSE